MSPLEIRFDQALDQAGLEARELAERMGVSKQTTSAMKKGRMIGKQYWPEIARHLNVDPAWLLTGKGKLPAWWIDPATGIPGASKMALRRQAIIADEAPASVAPAGPEMPDIRRKPGRPRKLPADPQQVLIGQQQAFITALQATIERLTAENRALREQRPVAISELTPTGSTS